TRANAPVRPALADLARVESITQYGITWRFAEPVRAGQFVNGDWYVVGRVTVSAVEPKPLYGAEVPEKELDAGERGRKVETRVRTRMQAILDVYGAGINVQGVEIARTEAPQQVIEAFNDVLAARQDAERNLNDARRYEQQMLAQAQGGAAEFNEIYEQYRLAPEVTRRRLYYETMESVLANTDKTIVEADGVTPYLPLPELRRRAEQLPAPGGQ
ncbi:MAG: hypothetical protein JJ992_04545, partial [Planctomycetes bacterium]|nr:hypothetical protein [Planctomycetota bacterium]